MTKRLKILLIALVGAMVLSNLLNLCIVCLPSSAPPATAREIEDAKRQWIVPVHEVADSGRSFH